MGKTLSKPQRKSEPKQTVAVVTRKKSIFDAVYDEAQKTYDEVKVVTPTITPPLSPTPRFSVKKAPEVTQIEIDMKEAREEEREFWESQLAAGEEQSNQQQHIEILQPMEDVIIPQVEQKEQQMEDENPFTFTQQQNFPIEEGKTIDVEFGDEIIRMPSEQNIQIDDEIVSLNDAILKGIEEDKQKMEEDIEQKLDQLEKSVVELENELGCQQKSGDQLTQQTESMEMKVVESEQPVQPQQEQSDVPFAQLFSQQTIPQQFYDKMETDEELREEINNFFDEQQLQQRFGTICQETCDEMLKEEDWEDDEKEMFKAFVGEFGKALCQTIRKQAEDLKLVKKPKVDEMELKQTKSKKSKKEAKQQSEHQKEENIYTHFVDEHLDEFADHGECDEDNFFDKVDTFNGVMDLDLHEELEAQKKEDEHEEIEVTLPTKEIQSIAKKLGQKTMKEMKKGKRVRVISRQTKIQNEMKPKKK